jgi:hypothetical protein
MTRAGHLVRRFAGSLRVRPLTDGDVAFVRGVLSEGELACWERLGPADRAESVATARAAIDALGRDVEERFVAAALLHDAGKAGTPLRTAGRSIATVVAAVAGHPRVRAWDNAVGRYVDHDTRGARLLASAGARPEAVAWAEAHHRPAMWHETGIPPAICAALAAADGAPYRR